MCETFITCVFVRGKQGNGRRGKHITNMSCGSLGLCGPGPYGLGPYGPGPYGLGPYGPPWALMGQALMGRALMGGALMGRALMGRALMAPWSNLFLFSPQAAGPKQLMSHPHMVIFSDVSHWCRISRCVVVRSP